MDTAVHRLKNPARSSTDVIDVEISWNASHSADTVADRADVSILKGSEELRVNVAWQLCDHPRRTEMPQHDNKSDRSKERYCARH